MAVNWLLHPIVNHCSTPFDTQILKRCNYIRKRQSRQVVTNSLFNDLVECPLSLHDLQVNPSGRLRSRLEKL